MISKQFSKEEEKAAKLEDEKRINSERKESPKIILKGVFDELIIVIKQKDQNPKKVIEVYVKFIDRWMFINKKLNENWRQDLYALFKKQSAQKQKEIMDCLKNYVLFALAKTDQERRASRYKPYDCLRTWFFFQNQPKNPILDSILSYFISYQTSKSNKARSKQLKEEQERSLLNEKGHYD